MIQITNHPDWVNLPSKQDAVPKWWSELIPLFRKSARSFELQYQGDGVFGVNDINPFYQDLGLDDNNGSHPLRICDQKHVFTRLVKEASGSNDNLQMLAIIHAVAYAIGRGGEATSQDPVWLLYVHVGTTVHINMYVRICMGTDITLYGN